MRVFFYFFLIFNVFISCNDNLKKKELELKEKELELKEKELNNYKTNTIEEVEINSVSQPIDDKDITIDTVAVFDEQEINVRYLMFSNAGILVFTNDGLIRACPRCDYSYSNINHILDFKITGYYEILNNGWLLINGNEKIKPENNGDWGVIEYEILVEPENY